MKTSAASPNALRATTMALAWDAWDPSIGAAVDIGALISEEINGIEAVREECHAATVDRAVNGNLDSALYLLIVDVPHDRGSFDLTDEEIGNLLGSVGD